MICHTPLRASTLFFTCALFATMQTHAQDLGTFNAEVFDPVTISLSSDTWAGNAYDLDATATFTHTPTGQQITRGLYYDGGDTWRLRFTGLDSGEWTFQTNSADADLSGRTGKVQVTANADARGFLVTSGTKYAWQVGSQNNLDATPYTVYMNRRSPTLQTNPGYGGDTDIVNTWGGPANADNRASYIQQAKDHGTNAIYLNVSNQWFKNGVRGWDGLTSEDLNPDQAVFSAIEDLITDAHAQGVNVHIWSWGDNADDRRWIPPPVSQVGTEGGINGTADRRIQRYIADRLGALPGWSMGVGFDLFEWTDQDQVSDWANFLDQRMGYVHPFSARGLPFEGPDGTEDDAPQHFVDSYASFLRRGQILETDGSAPIDDGGPDSYYLTLEDLQNDGQRPIIYEERHGYQRHWTDDNKIDWPTTSMDGTRRLFWWWTMAGGAGGWIGFYPDDNPASAAGPYPNPEQLRTHTRFFEDRFFLDSTPALDLVAEGDNLVDGLSRTYALASASENLVIYFAEDTDSIDLSKLDIEEIVSITAVHTQREYNELLFNKDYLVDGVWHAPLGISADWALAVQLALDVISADLNGDGVIDVTDLNLAIGNFTGSDVTTSMTRAQGDLDSDGDIDNADIGVILGQLTAPLDAETIASFNVPEPTSAALLATGGLLLARRRR